MYATLGKIIKYALEGDTKRVKHYCNILIMQIDLGQEFKKGISKEKAFSSETLENIVAVLTLDKEE